MVNLTHPIDGQPADDLLADFQLNDAHPAYWQTEPCPAWCACPEDHRPSNHPDDRIHFGATWAVTLTLADAEVAWVSTPGSAHQVCIPRLDAYLRQGWREREARIELSVNDSPGTELTLAEAEKLAGILSNLVREAREAAGGPS